MIRFIPILSVIGGIKNPLAPIHWKHKNWMMHSIRRSVKQEMCLYWLLVAFIPLVVGCNDASPGSSTPDVASDSLELVWSDEFNGVGSPDTTHWRFEHGFVRNEENQWYQEENAWMEDGCLIIEARLENKKNPLFQSNSSDWRKSRPIINYTSSSIHTRGNHEWRFGRFEMRAKIDIRTGFWPAWWTLGSNGRWPANGEIDIMEYYRGMLLANVACLGREGKTEWHDTRLDVNELGGDSWAAQFHTWRMDWDATQIGLYVDDRLLNKVILDDVANKDGSGNPFRQPHFILLDFALGGANGGPIDDALFPARFIVDYVRVYQ